MINNRQQQAGRRRGRGGQGPGNGPRPQGGRPDNGNRIDNRARGNASQLYEKYQALARDAQMHGDRVNTETYLQYADHYFRVLAETRSRTEEQQPRRQREDNFDAGDEEYGDEGEQVRGNEQGRGEQPRAAEQSRGEQNRSDQNRGEPRQRDGQREGQGGREPRRDGRRDEWRSEAGQRDGAQRDGGQPDGNQRDEGQRDGGQRDAGQRDRGQRDFVQRDSAPRGGEREPRREYRDEPRAESRNGRSASYGEASPAKEAGAVVDQPTETANDLVTQQPPEAEAPKRRGRPRREVAVDAAEPAPVFEADRLPPALGISPASGDAEEKPRRRRGRPPAAEAAAE